MSNLIVPYKDALYEVLEVQIGYFDFPASQLIQVTVRIREFKNRKNHFDEFGLFISNYPVTEECVIARTLFKNTLESEDFYA